MNLDPLSRIMRRVKKTGTCWLWLGSKNHYGYGQIGIGQNVFPVHRVIFQLVKGNIPKGMLVCHSCDTPPCVNPDHLWVGTPQDNADDMKSKGRQRRCINRRKLSDRDVKTVFRSRLPRSVLAKRYGVSYQAIRDIQIRRTWKSVLPHPEIVYLPTAKKEATPRRQVAYP